MGAVIAGYAFVMAVGSMILLYKAPVVDIIVCYEVAERDLMVRFGVAVRGVILRAGLAVRGVILGAGLAAVNVVQTAYNAVEAITNGLMAANPVGFVVIAIAALAAGFVLAYNTLKLFHDAVNG